MRVRHKLAWAAFVFLGTLAPATTARAGFMDWCSNCPPPAYYSPVRYWAPGLARVHDLTHGPKLSVYAVDRHPEIPPTYVILSYPCPAVPAAATFIERPTPPPESKAR